MANNDNNILQELEKADEYNEKIKCEINNVLQESDCALVKAETQINEIIFNDTFKRIEKDIEISSDSSYALSIEVSHDLFKEFDNEHNISAIYPSSVDDIPSKKLPDVPEEPKISEVFVTNKINEDEDTTIKNYIPDVPEVPKISGLKNNETLGSSLEITITNDVGDDKKDEELETTLLYNSPTFEGCSKEFASNGVEEKITVIVDVEKGRSVLRPLTENNKPEEKTKILQEKPLNEAVDNQPKNIKTDINSNNETSIPPKTQKITLKRANDENYPLDVVDAKKLKFDECQAKTSGTSTRAPSPDFDFTQTEYSQVIFDPDETADANNPKWSEFNNNFTSIEEHFESVRKQWRSMALPNPHKNLTTRFVPEQQYLKYKSETPADNSGYFYMSCVSYLDNKINRYTQKVNSLYVKLSYLPQSNRGRSQRNKLLREIDELQKFVIEIVKNREEIQQNFKFYQDPNNTWNANYLTRNELDEMKEQEKMLEFQKKFYSR